MGCWWKRKENLEVWRKRDEIWKNWKFGGGRKEKQNSAQDVNRFLSTTAGRMQNAERRVCYTKTSAKTFPQKQPLLSFWMSPSRANRSPVSGTNCLEFLSGRIFERFCPRNETAVPKKGLGDNKKRARKTSSAGGSVIYLACFVILESEWCI